jgi:hypothetical protein
VGFDATFELVEERPDRELTLQGAKSNLDFGELDVLFPELFGVIRRADGYAADRFFVCKFSAKRGEVTKNSTAG